MSRHLGNLIGNVHAFHHFTKYRVTEITLTMVKEGVIGNLRYARWIGLRAISSTASVKALQAALHAAWLPVKNAAE